ncbi:MAG: DUF799 family lipoprotein [Elusimicrobia bacterium]|nr:DUF799 family lipoprotein [Elusimicrobiota bacterium]
MALRRLIWLVPAFCACAPAFVGRRADVALPPAAPPACHLVVSWKDASPNSDPKPPSRAAETIAKIVREQPRESCREIASWQVVSDPAKLVAWSRVYRPELPVLWVSVINGRSGEEGKRKIHAGVQVRLQAGLFDTSEEPPQVVTDTWTDAYESEMRRILGAARLEPKATALSIRPLEGERAKEAMAAAQRGEWAASASLWAELAGKEPDQLAAAANASAAYELAGDTKAALAWQGKLLDSAQGIGGQFRLLMLQQNDGSEREAALAGKLALEEPPFAELSAGSTLAVLPLDNETPDMDADERVRRGVTAAIAAAGYSPIDAAAVDDRLKKDGITMAGHLKALKWSRIGKRVKAEFLVAGAIEEFRMLPRRQVRVRLSLIHAPTDREVVAETVESADLVQTSKTAGGAFAETLVSAIAQKVMKKPLAEETADAAERWARGWPHFKR